MALKLAKQFPVHLFGPKLLKLVQDWGRTKCGTYGPDITGITLKGHGMNWKIIGTWPAGFVAHDTGTKGSFGFGRFRWQGRFIDAEEDFDF